jgi:hypothetical protein
VKRRKFVPGTDTAWLLKVSDPGYIVSQEAVDKMLTDHDLLNKNVYAIVATPRHLHAYAYGSRNQHHPQGHMYRRRWRA